MGPTMGPKMGPIDAAKSNLSNPYLISMLLGLVDAQFAPTAFSTTYKPKRVVQSPIFFRLQYTNAKLLVGPPIHPIARL